MHIYITPEEYEAAAAHGISARTLNLRIRTYGWPKERALIEPVQQRTDWSEWYAVAAENGITPLTFRARIYRGWPPERAAAVPPRPRRKKDDRQCSTIES